MNHQGDFSRRRNPLDKTKIRSDEVRVLINLKELKNTDCKCNFCIHQQCIPETRWEPAEYYCDEDSDNYGTDWGCWLFEDAEEAADAAADRAVDDWRERQMEKSDSAK